MSGVRTLTQSERATVLALAVSVDFDYFSLHSGGYDGVMCMHSSCQEPAALVFCLVVHRLIFPLPPPLYSRPKTEKKTRSL